MTDVRFTEDNYFVSSGAHSPAVKIETDDIDILNAIMAYLESETQSSVMEKNYPDAQKSIQVLLEMENATAELVCAVLDKNALEEKKDER